ncbi:hypothetical protein [Streptomyces sp. LUP47B]|uniref:hypothetical protein n=1 Tax=Streptomyces sp. LUP47B TaxID=1890286 RepID=UPI0008519163|nr:hypothetical protein [Streptomyces sp. LUP47B]
MNIIKPAALLLAAGALVAGSAAAVSAAVPDSREGTAPDGTRVTVVTDGNRDWAAPADRDLSTPDGTRVTGGYHPDGTRVTGVQPSGTRVT